MKKQKKQSDISTNTFAIAVMLFAAVFMMFEFFILLLVAPYWA